MLSSRSCAVLALSVTLTVAGCGAGGQSDDPPGSGGVGGSAGQAGAAGVGGASGGAAGAGASGGSGASAGSGGSSGAAGGAGTGGSASCPAPPACDAPLPDFGPKRSWNDFLSNAIASGPPYHRGRDLFLTPGDEQWIIGKFTYYFPIDKDLKGEDIDVWLLRDCGTSWEFLGTAQTSKDNMHATVEGVPDTGGRIYFKIPAGKELGLGRHRVHLVVAGDHTGTELFIEVVPKGTHIFVTDIDGTLTTTETEEFTALLTGATPNANPGAAQALTTLAAKGYRPYYLSARPEFLVERSREFVKLRGFPPGIIHTNTNLTGALGSAAAAYKLADLQVVASHGIDTSYGIGNTDSDAAAYFDDGINPSDHRILYKFTDSVHNGRRVDDYSALFAEFAALPTVCP